MNGGRSTVKRINYNKMKKMVREYISQMDVAYDEYVYLIDIFYNHPFEAESMEEFDIKKALEFIRTWDIIKNELKETDKNLVLAFEVCRNYKDMLDGFEGSYKSEGSLRVMVYNARKRIKEIYDRKYGNN